MSLMDAHMEDAPGTPPAGRHAADKHAKANEYPLPEFDIDRILNVPGGNRRFRTELLIVGAKHCQSSGEPIPQPHPFMEHIHQIIVLGQDAAGDDLLWLQHLAPELSLHKTISLELPTFCPSK